MRHIIHPSGVLTAAAQLLTIDKPVGGKVTLRSLSCWSDSAQTFMNMVAFFRNQEHNEQKGIINTVIQNCETYPENFWQGWEDWPEGYELCFYFTNQTASAKMQFVVGYDIPEKKKRTMW